MRVDQARIGSHRAGSRAAGSWLGRNIGARPGWPADGGGFTLIEVLITLAITSVLSLIALPSFQNQVQRVRRSDALVAIIQVQLAESRWRANGPVYASLADLGVQQVSGSGHYRLQLDGESPEGYRLVATALGSQAGDAVCRVFVLTVIGAEPIRSSGPDVDIANDAATNRRCWGS